MFDAVDVLKLAGGIVYLILGGDLLVRGAISLARRSQLSPALIGLTIIALGTSAPEFIVSILAAVSGHGAIAIGNIVGSNIANVLLVLGVAAIVYPMSSDSTSSAIHACFMVAVCVLFIGMCFLGPLGRIDGSVMLAVLATGLFVTLRSNFSILNLAEDDPDDSRVLGLPNTPGFMWMFVTLGCVVMPLGADLTVRSASNIALGLGVGEAVIGASIVALGTTLPELIATLIATMHKQVGMAIGNLIGSNVLNILAIMGLTSVITLVPVPDSLLTFDLWFMLGCAALLWFLVIRKIAIGRFLGTLFIGAYTGYVWIIY
jgi:cation:H+ antiporter